MIPLLNKILVALGLILADPEFQPDPNCCLNDAKECLEDAKNADVDADVEAEPEPNPLDGFQPPGVDFARSFPAPRPVTETEFEQ